MSKTASCIIREKCSSNLSVYVQQNSNMTCFTSSDSWTILSSIEAAIKQKIEAAGIRLKDWNVRINRGILTGCNEAFIISGDKRNELISQNPKSAEIIRPILRGRDIKRYSYEHADLWLISTFPSRHYDIENYPAVKEHLLSFGIQRLEQTGAKHIVDGIEVKARKKTSNKWFETQDSISYWDDLSMQKIVWGEISDKPKFAIDVDGEYYPEATTFLMTGEHLKYLLCFLNSTLSEYFFAKYGTTTGMGTLRWKKYLIELLPIPEPTPDKEAIITHLLDKLLQSNGNDHCLIEQINQEIYKLFGLTSEEVNFIEEMVDKGAH